jgi:hypothetical protein
MAQQQSTVLDLAELKHGAKATRSPLFANRNRVSAAVFRVLVCLPAYEGRHRFSFNAEMNAAVL